MSRANKLITLEVSGIDGGDRCDFAGETCAQTELLEQARQAVVEPCTAPEAVERSYWSGVESLPAEILEDYVQRRERSQLGRILQTARRLRDGVDRVVLLGGASWMWGGRIAQAAGCEPYFDQLTRAQRGGRLRLIFADYVWDNDALSGLIDLLVQGRSPDRWEDRWALLTLPDRQAERVMPPGWAALFHAWSDFYGRAGGSDGCVGLSPCGGPLATWAPVGAEAAESGRGLQVSGEFSLFSPAGLLPAACLGLDVVRMLEGAARISDRFRSAPRGENPAWDYAAIAQRLAPQLAGGGRVLRLAEVALTTLGSWYTRLFERFEQAGVEVSLPRSVVATRDRLPPVPRDGRRLWLTDVTVDRVRCDPCCGQYRGDAERGSGASGDRSSRLTEQAAGRLHEALRPYQRGGVPIVRIRLPQLNAWTLGQLLQMLMLATVVENLMQAAVCRKTSFPRTAAAGTGTAD